MTVLWVGVLLAAVWAAHWGAEHLSDPLKKLRRQWGFSVAAGGSFVGLAAASPEISINPGFSRWIRPTRPKAAETLAKLPIPTFTLRVRRDSATWSTVRV